MYLDISQSDVSWAAGSVKRYIPWLKASPFILGEFFIMPLFPYLTNREETRNSDFFEKFNKFYFYSPNFPVQSTEPTKMFKFSEEISVYAYFCVYVCVHPLLSQIPLKPWFIICLCFKQREWKFISSFF